MNNTEENNTIHTIGELINFLKSLNANDKILSAEYIYIINNTFISLENRPLLKSLFEKQNDGSYKIKAMFY